MKTTIVGMLLSPLLLMAQQNSGAWTNIGPSPAAVRAIAVDAQGSGTIFMGTIAGGVRKSVDGGITWSTVNSGLTRPFVRSLAMDASGPQTVYAGAGGLFKTDDGGATWRNLPAISGAVPALAADPNRSGVVYAGVFNNLVNGRIMKSIDGGVTWVTILPVTAGVINITIDPGNSDVLYVPTVGRGAFKSTDGGQHWSPMPALTPEAIWTLALDPANSHVLYAGTNEDGIWKSTDAGNTWQYAGSPGPFPVYSLTVDPSPAHTIYAGTNGGGVRTSSDGGVTWQSTRLSDGTALSLAVGPAGALYAGTSSAGVQVSHDLGATWTTAHTGVEGVNRLGYGVWIDPANGQKIFVGTELGYGMVQSQDGGASWSPAGRGFTGWGSRGVSFDPSNAQRIYAGATIGNGFFKSTDGGLSWSRRRFGSPAVYVIAVAVDPLSPNYVYAGTQNEGLFKSADYGDTWRSTGKGLSGAITYLTLDPSKSGRLFASTATAFHVSEDGGESWTNILNMPAWTVTIAPNLPSTVYATARTQGIFRSADGGRTWQGINTGLTNLNLGASAPVIIDPTNPQTLYVGTSGGVFKSLDGGDHWFAVTSGLDELEVEGLAMDPRNPAVLYACGPNGVYKTVTGGEVQSAPTISAVLNGASYSPDPITPGEIVVITGSGLGPGQLIPATRGSNGLYSAQLSGTEVRFNAIPAPLIYTSATQIAALVPELPLNSRAQVTVTYDGRTSTPYTTELVVPAAPGVFTLDASGKGQAVALNPDGSLNTASNSAKVGDVISLYATGVGRGTVTVAIGSAPLQWFGISTSTKQLALGVSQIDATLPSGIQSGSAVPVLVVVGDDDANTSSQRGVTIAVR